MPSVKRPTFAAAAFRRRHAMRYFETRKRTYRWTRSRELAPLRGRVGGRGRPEPPARGNPVAEAVRSRVGRVPRRAAAELAQAVLTQRTKEGADNHRPQ